MFGILVSVMRGCYTTREIAERLDIPQRTVADRLNAMSEKLQLQKIAHEPPESLRIYDVWNFSKCDERLLYDERDS
jgi:DNA-binding MarR family transcriptional regulator